MNGLYPFLFFAGMALFVWGLAKWIEHNDGD